ncbi:MAG: glycine--tRNA ligase subunit beta [Candidatus Lindowbacteria bacterium RIFCSPLOWO2_02_FULL_62_12]|nr:MAG: glycine--tRNA ligase subunit beta [Candidatus Lindowbacteria bacterium RIFCSPLOWO2_02_FULL_62_12]
MILARRGLSADLPEDLVTEVVHLTEFPTVLLGGFDRSFLDIPAVILKSAMSHHQRYFPVTAAGGKLAPHFLVVRNGPPDPKGIVAKGNARVLTARFSDTKYFFETDRKKKLADRIDGLKGVVYLEGLGTLHDRARRLRDLLVILPPRIGIDLDLDRYADVAYLCKADLLTEVVREFPELQGVMGRIYAEKEGLPAEIPAAIAEHYQPRGPADPLPETPLGALLALADKFELLFGAYSVGLRPTASGDPYGLRRAAIGIARILLARAWHLRIGQMAESAAPIFPDPGAVRKAAPEVLAFFRARLEALLRETHPAEFVLACLNVSDDPCEIAGKVEAFSKIAREGKDRWVTLLRTAKRAHNIVKNEKNLPPLNPGAFQQEEERALHKAFLDWEAAVRRMPERKYTDRLRAILEMAAPLHTFFDKVFVMVDDASLRANRLSLIGAISDAFRSYAEFDRIAVSE